MNINNIHTVEDMHCFINNNIKNTCISAGRESTYTFIRTTLLTVRYTTLRKKEKGIVLQYIQKVSNYDIRQVKRLISLWQENGLIFVKRKRVGASLCVYTTEDIDLLIKTDRAHGCMNGLATKTMLMREVLTFGKEEYRNIANISVSHLYNIRNTHRQYLSSDVMRYAKTQAVSTPIGERKKPDTQGKPGYIRVDTVHQGDKDKEKGLYHINFVDEVTQWEIIGCVPQITDTYMKPLLEEVLVSFPFTISNFHSDNGGEYINYTVEKILERLLITQTKSRSRTSTDNALVEGKNGSIIRKHIGRNFINKSNAESIHTFFMKYFNTYLNYHRVCLYATLEVDKRGKIHKKYKEASTPYERLKSLDKASSYLREGVTFTNLDVIAYAKSDNEYATLMQEEKKKIQLLIKNSPFSKC